MNVVTTRAQPRRRQVFHELSMVEVGQLTDDAVVVTFAVPDTLRPTFDFAAGQHLTVRRMVDGVDVRRSYSISSTPAELHRTGRLRIGIKRIPGGAFSGYAATLRAGQTVEVLPPLGSFTSAFDPGRSRRYAAVVAGSGITPVLSLVATALATEPASRFTLLYGNRYARGVMFVEELSDLKDRYPDRLQVVHVLSREPQDAELLSGRLDADRLGRLLDALVPAETVDEWFLCGPYRMVLDAKAVLGARGVPADRIRTELFHVEAAPPSTREPGRAADDRPGGAANEPPGGDADDPPGGDAEITIRLDGRASSFIMPRDGRVLDAALRVRPDLPYACKGGVCSTCRARVLDGAVSMARNFALEPDEVAAGYVLTCQSSPVTDRVTVDYDA